MNLEKLSTAVTAYFSSEAAEMYCLIVGGGVAFALALLLIVSINDRFSQSLAVMLVLIGLLLGGTGVSLLKRDNANEAALLSVLNGGDSAISQPIIEAERDRMQTVVDAYTTYRYMFAGAAVIGAALILFVAHPIAMGVAVGLFIFAGSGVVIDHFSEQRAVIYLEVLQSSI